MISNQVLQNTLEGLKEISRTEFCVLDTEGKVLASTFADFSIATQDVQAFVESQADSQLVKGFQYFKVCDDYQLEYILVAHGDDEDTYMVGKLAAFQIQNLIVAYKERFDKDMFGQFLMLAYDQVSNQANAMRYMFGGQTKVPITYLVQNGTGPCVGPHHSNSVHPMFMNIPLVKVVMPSCPKDAKGLLKSSIRDDNPVIFFNHTSIGGMKGEVPEGEFTIPLGKGEIKKEGSDITLCAVGLMVNTCLKAAAKLEKEGIHAEVVDLRTLKPWDKELVLESVRKTGRFLAVDESYHTCGAGAEWVATVAEEGFHDLKCPASRLDGVEIPIPFSPALQKYAVPSVETIQAKVKEMIQK